MSDDSAALRDVLWKMCQEHYTHIRHYETQRSTVAGTLIAITAALIGIVTFDKALGPSDLPLTTFLFILGGFGAMFSAKQHERASLHALRAQYYRDELDQLLIGAPLKRLKQQADTTHQKQFPRLNKLRIHKFWIGFYLLIASLGLMLSLVSGLFPLTASSP